MSEITDLQMRKLTRNYKPVRIGPEPESERGPSKVAAPAGSLGVGGGCLEVSSAEVLDVASYLDERAADWRNCQLRHEKAGEALESVEYFKARKVLKHCSEILRRHAAALKKRQPQDNVPGQERALPNGES